MRALTRGLVAFGRLSSTFASEAKPGCIPDAYTRGREHRSCSAPHACLRAVFVLAVIR
jgi:hypothetical protein